MYKDKRFEEGENMGEEKGVQRKQCKIKVIVKRNDDKRRDAEDDGERIEAGVKKIEDNSRIKLENAVLDFVRMIEVERVKKGLR